MNIGILGTGSVGETIGSRLIELGHTVKMGSRTAANEKAAAWVAKEGASASAGTFADAAVFGEIVFNCTKGEFSLDALTLAGAENLKNKVLIDIANPLDFSNGMPPSLSISNTDSLGELLQRSFPDTHIVKALNTMWCGIMVNPRMLNGTHHTYICGNNADAKQKVAAILHQFGWAENEVLDLGDITNARGTESVLPIWLRVYGATKNGVFNFGIVTA
ncbi:MAG: NADPH-dependent F420 reductase [Bacteroidia bacterium]